jgi:Nuclease-related domain
VALGLVNGAVVSGTSERAPGQYARERYRRALNRYRQRMRGPVLVLCVPVIVGATALAIWRDTDPWWYFAGGVFGGTLMAAMYTLGDPPQHIANWGAGWKGEQRTAKALRPLLRNGWSVKHDVQHPRENLDHVLVGPPGVFLLETKVRTGTVSVEDGALTIRYFDDPDEVITLLHLAATMRRRAAALRATHRFESGMHRWVTPVVVLWAHFPDRHVEHDGVTYIDGRELVGWLRSLPSV